MEPDCNMINQTYSTRIQITVQLCLKDVSTQFITLRDWFVHLNSHALKNGYNTITFPMEEDKLADI